MFHGDLLEDLLDEANPRRTEVTDRMLACIDVLVDGPYIKELHDISLRFRGSSNQRIIDMPGDARRLRGGPVGRRPGLRNAYHVM